MAERRRKKFKPDPSVSFQLQERDVDIIHDVYTHRFLDTSLITLKTGASRQAVQRRLNKLYHKGYLSRPERRGRDRGTTAWSMPSATRERACLPGAMTMT